MINHYPLWKNLLVVAVLVIGILYALPNIFGEDYAVQVSAERGRTVDAGMLHKLESALKSKGESSSSSKIEDNMLVMRFGDQETQLKALATVNSTLDDGYTSALNLVPKTPQWLVNIGGDPMNLGLDLRGGVHFLMEVDMNEAMKKKVETYTSDFRTLMRKKKVRYSKVGKTNDDGIIIQFRKEDSLDQAKDLIRREYQGLVFDELDRNDEFGLKINFTEAEVHEIKKFALEQNITTLRNRVNELGVAEPIIQQQGDNRIVVQLPGIQDTTRAKDILGATATLEFRLVDEKNDPYEANTSGRIPPLSILRMTREGTPVLLQKRVLLTGDSITDAASGIEQQNGTPAVFITLDGKGARRMSDGTRDNIGKRMAVVFIENKVSSKMVDGKRVRTKKTTEEVINVAVIQDQLNKRFQVTGLDSIGEAKDLALLLRAGALAVPMEIIEERTVGPNLGQDNIDKGMLSVMVGMALVLIFMAVYYKVFGLVANLALVFNVVMVVALLSIIQAVLTLPGIAGIVLTVGMAVDANVLIFERIKEELKVGNSPQASIHAGYDKAFSTIMDANITTLIAAAVLFAFGTGAIKGFAITLALGIVTSMFTAIVGTRAVVNLIYGSRNIKKLSI
jgi:preprotein translocase subunit SecD